MKNTTRLSATWLVCTLTLGVCLPAAAQDATAVGSVHYRVAFESEAVRVLRVTYGPGERSVMHTHPAGMLVSLTDGEGRFTSLDGSTQTFRWEAGQVEWVPTMAHLPENAGDAPYELLLIEMKEAERQRE